MQAFPRAEADATYTADTSLSCEDKELIPTCSMDLSAAHNQPKLPFLPQGNFRHVMTRARGRGGRGRGGRGGGTGGGGGPMRFCCLMQELLNLGVLQVACPQVGGICQGRKGMGMGGWGGREGGVWWWGGGASAMLSLSHAGVAAQPRHLESRMPFMHALKWEGHGRGRMGLGVVCVQEGGGGGGVLL